VSQRELLLVLAHAHGCTLCRDRLLTEPASVFRGRSLNDAEKEALTRLKSTDFITPELLSRATGITMSQLEEYRDHPVARLRHF
jgi:hypothetical protein